MIALSEDARRLVAEAHAHIGAATMQMIASDDQIITEHIRAAEVLLRAALRTPSWPPAREVDDGR